MQGGRRRRCPSQGRPRAGASGRRPARSPSARPLAFMASPCPVPILCAPGASSFLLGWDGDEALWLPPPSLTVASGARGPCLHAQSGALKKKKENSFFRRRPGKQGVGQFSFLPKLEGRGPAGCCSRGPGGQGVPASPLSSFLWLGVSGL